MEQFLLKCVLSNEDSTHWSQWTQLQHVEPQLVYSMSFPVQTQEQYLFTDVGSGGSIQIQAVCPVHMLALDQDWAWSSKQRSRHLTASVES